MNITRQLGFAIAFLSLFAVSLQPAPAAKQCCDSCGGRRCVKTICRPQYGFKEIDFPKYSWELTRVIHPHKGRSCRPDHRRDVIYKLEATNCRHGACCRDACCTRVRCTKETQCKTYYGAKPSACQGDSYVAQPKSTCRQHVPTVNWVTIHLCKKCRARKPCRGK